MLTLPAYIVFLHLPLDDTSLVHPVVMISEVRTTSRTDQGVTQTQTVHCSNMYVLPKQILLFDSMLALEKARGWRFDYVLFWTDIKRWF